MIPTLERQEMVSQVAAIIRMELAAGCGNAKDVAEAIVGFFLDAPEVASFLKGTALEAQHQRARWGAEGDAGKTDADWFWLIGWLGGKAVHNPGTTPEDAIEKKLHRIITVAAACLNWHAQVLGKTNMRPGIAPPTEVSGG